jgi:hypothetical protein
MATINAPAPGTTLQLFDLILSASAPFLLQTALHWSLIITSQLHSCRRVCLAAGPPAATNAIAGRRRCLGRECHGGGSLSSSASV